LEKQISESEKIRLFLVIEPHGKMDAESLSLGFPVRGKI